ncbi:MAG: FkbM family methyltransferase, partial [Pseudonocardiaceae bacterium]
AGRAHLAAARSEHAAARWVAGRLAEAFERWQRHPGSGLAAATHLDAAREALRWRADPYTPSRVPLAPLLRRTVLRTVDHYDQHQRTMLAALLDHLQAAMQSSADETLTRMEARLTAQETTFQARIRELTTLLEDRVDAVAGQVAAQVQATGRAATERADQLDHKFVEMLSERDESIDALSAADADQRADLALLHSTVLQHHDVLDSVADAAESEAVVTDVGVLRLPANDTVVLPWLHEYGSWEPSEAAIIDQLLFPGATFVDIGAHVGYFSLLALRRVGPQGAVIAVEPWPTACELLDRNVRSNIAFGLRPALTVLENAAWDVSGPLRLRTASDGNSGDNRITPDGELIVPGIRLDDVPGIRDRTVHVVKVDTQGRDHRALQGMRSVLLRDQPHVLCEFWPDGIRESGDEPHAVLARYREWGYRPRLIGADGDSGDGFAATDLVRLAEESAQEFVNLWLQPEGTPART